MTNTSSSQQATTRLSGSRGSRSQSSRQPVSELSLDGWKLSEAFKVIQGPIPHTRPAHQEVFCLALQVPTDAMRITAAFEDFLEIAHQMAPAQRATFEPGVGTATIGVHNSTIDLAQQLPGNLAASAGANAK